MEEKMNEEQSLEDGQREEDDIDYVEDREELTEERIKDMLDAREYKELKEELETNMYPVDLAEILEEFDQKHMVLVFRLLAKEEAAETFSYMDSDTREDLINALTDSELEEIMEEMYLDDTVDVLEEMPANVVDRLLMVTDEEKRQQINQLLQYPEDSAGSVMNVDYIALRREMTVAESILKIRQVGLNRETIYTCYVTEQRHLIGQVDVKELLTSSESKTIEEIMDTNMLYARTTDDQEDVANTITKYGLIALPIVDHENCMVGIVTVDDAMQVLQEETTEDISIMAGVNPNEDSYFGTSIFEHVKSRIPWLLFLMISATFSSLVIRGYEDALAAVTVLTAYIPMLTDAGGNAGSQSTSTIIRGMAVGEIQPHDLPRILWRESRVALLCGATLAVCNFAKLLLFDKVTAPVALVVCLTLICTILLSQLIGGLLPVAAEKLHVDPAVMASPLITTIVDATTLLIYFNVAKIVLHL